MDAEPRGEPAATVSVTPRASRKFALIAAAVALIVAATL
jgi:hypothetical protein